MAKKAITLCLSEPAINILRREAEKNGLSMSSLVEILIRQPSWFNALDRLLNPTSEREKENVKENPSGEVMGHDLENS